MTTKNFFNKSEDFDFWGVAKSIRDVYMSDGLTKSLIDYERVLDELDIYAFENWEKGELVQGPDVGKYRVTCIFMWPEKMMPDPRGAKRLLPFDCDVEYLLQTVTIPIKIKSPDDYEDGTKKARKVKRKFWFVKITIPKDLMTDIRTGAIELEDQIIDLDDLDEAYEEDLDQQEFQTDGDMGDMNEFATAVDNDQGGDPFSAPQ